MKRKPKTLQHCEHCPLRNVRVEDRQAARDPRILARYRRVCVSLKSEGECLFGGCR